MIASLIVLACAGFSFYLGYKFGVYETIEANEWVLDNVPAAKAAYEEQRSLGN